MSQSAKHALTLIADPKFAVAKDDLKKLQSAAIAQIEAVGQLESNAARGGILSGLTLLRVKASLPYGQFGKWLDQISTSGGKVKVKKSQASNYMRLSLTFLEKTKLQRPDLLSLPGDETSLDLVGNQGAKKFVEKLNGFVGELSLNELLIKHGIKGVGLKTELEKGDDAEPAAPASGDDPFADLAQTMHGWRTTITSRETIARLSTQQLETLHQEVTSGAEEFRRLYEEVKGKGSAIKI